MAASSGFPLRQILSPLIFFTHLCSLFVVIVFLFFLFCSFLDIPPSSSLVNMHCKVVVLSGSGELLGDQAEGQSMILPYVVSSRYAEKSQ